MKIGVTGDTHIPIVADTLPLEIESYFRGVDLILHTGDLVDLMVIDMLSKIAPVEAVKGNMDSYTVQSKLPSKKVIEAGSFKIGLIHGWGSPDGIEKRIRAEFDKIDCLVFGHTHHSLNIYEDGILFFNPGSPTDKRFTDNNSIGILEINESVKGKIIDIPGTRR